MLKQAFLFILAQNLFEKNPLDDLKGTENGQKLVVVAREMGLTLEKGQLFDLGEIGEVIVTKVAALLMIHLNNRIHLG